MRRNRAGTRKADSGFAYLALMISIAVIGVAGEFQRAFVSYAMATPLGQPTQPRTIDELLRDPRYPNPVRHLRKLYADPMTGKADWVLVKSPDGQTIAGIHSASKAHPIKIAQFPAEFQGFGKKRSYTEWVFIARFPTLTQGSRPAASPPQATAGDAPPAVAGDRPSARQ
jgi:type II secretory pathway pseudopilin PulG